MIPLKTVLTDMFGRIGMNVQMSGDIANVAQDYWNVNDSPGNFLARIARDRGGLAKIANNTAMIIPTSGGINSIGTTMATVDAVWGVNLIGWRIKPYAGRPQYGEAQSRFFKLFDGEWDKATQAIGGSTPFGGTNAITHAVAAVANKTESESTNKGAKEQSDLKRGKGWVLLNGEPRCCGGCHILITGARPGVDGTYLVTEAEHNYTRGGGYTTRANVQYPEPTGGNRKGFRYTTPKPGETKSTVEEQSTDPTAPGYVPRQSYDPRAPGYVAPIDNPMGDVGGVTQQGDETPTTQSTNPNAPNYVKPQQTDPNAPGYFDPNKNYSPFEPGGIFNPIR